MRTLVIVGMLALGTALLAPTSSATTVTCTMNGSGVDSETQCQTSGVSGVHDATLTCWSHSYDDHFEAGCTQAGVPIPVLGSCTSVSYDGGQHGCERL